MRPANILNLGLKEVRSLLRDPTMLVLIVWAFTFAIHLVATAIPETLHKAPVAVVDEDRSPLSRRIIDAFYPPYFLKPSLITGVQMDERMDAGLDTFALCIPPDFQRDVMAGLKPALQLNIDATRMSQAFAGSGYIRAIIEGEVAEFILGRRSTAVPQVDLELRARFNPQMNRAWFGGVMKLIDNITMLSIILTGAALLREREHGTIEHLLVMPVSPIEIMTSKVLSMVVVVFVAASFSLIFVVQGTLGVHIEGSIPLFLFGTVLHLLAAASLGIFLGTISRSMPQFSLLLMLVLLPMQILSGSVTPRESMPEFIKFIMLAAPNTHFVLLAQAVLFRGAGLNVVWPQLASLSVISAALFFFSLARFRKALGTMQ